MKKSWNLPSSFLNLSKSLENGNKVWKNGKKSWVFFFQSYNKFISDFCFVLLKSYSVSTVWWKELYSCIFKGLYWSPSLEKEIIVLEKRLEKVSNFGSKNLYELWTKKLMYYSLLSLNIISFVLFPKALMSSLNFNNIEIGLLAWINYI